MAHRRNERVGLVMVLLAGAATVLLTPSPASACSVGSARTFEIEGAPQAGGTLEITGTGWWSTTGFMDADCSGDWTFVPVLPMTVVVDFQTMSGPRSIAIVAVVDGPTLPHQDATEDLDEQYVLDASAAIPPDATSVVAHLGRYEAEADISGAVATTVPAPPTTPAAPASAAPANAVTGSPTFTG